MGSWVLFIIGAVAIVFVMQGRVTSLAQRRRQIFSDITPLLEQRYDLLDRLGKKLEEQFPEESAKIASLTALRIAARDAYGTGSEKFAAELKLGQAAKEFLDWMSGQSGWEQDHQDLQDLDRNISEKVNFFNGITSEYNAALKQFPASFLARFTKAVAEPLFEAPKKSANKRIS